MNQYQEIVELAHQYLDRDTHYGLMAGQRWNNFLNFSKEKILPVLKKAAKPAVNLLGEVVPEVRPITTLVSRRLAGLRFGSELTPLSSVISVDEPVLEEEKDQDPIKN